MSEGHFCMGCNQRWYSSYFLPGNNYCLKCREIEEKKENKIDTKKFDENFNKIDWSKAIKDESEEESDEEE